MKRILVASMMWLLALAGPAAAKMPPFETTVEVEGDEAAVTVVLEGYDPEVQELSGLLGLYLAADIEGVGTITDGAAFAAIDFTPIPLTRVDDFTYQGSVTIPFDGEWAVVPFPGTNPPPPESLYPTVRFTTQSAVSASAGAPNVESTPPGNPGDREAFGVHSVDPATAEELSSGFLPTGMVGLYLGTAGAAALALVAGRALKGRRNPTVG